MINLQKISLLFGCASAGLLAYITLDMWSARNAPIYKRFERQWAADVERLEASGQLPSAWKEVKDIEVIGGTPETKGWLRRIDIPLRSNPKGKHKMETLVVAWEENGKRGVLVQYNIEDGKTKNNIFELGRTLILADKNQPISNLFETTKK